MLSVVCSAKTLVEKGCVFEDGVDVVWSWFDWEGSLKYAVEVKRKSSLFQLNIQDLSGVDKSVGMVPAIAVVSLGIHRGRCTCMSKLWAGRVGRSQ